MKIKFQVAMAAFAAATMFAPLAAKAADVSHAVQTVDLSEGSKDYGASFGRNNKNNTFTDLYTFTVGGGEFSALTSSISTTPGPDVLALTGFWLTQGTSVVATGSQKQNGSTDLWSIDLTTLGSGTYTLHVKGTVLTNLAASYSGNLNLVAVPEPETYAMLLGGLGLIGFAARRKKQAA